MNENDMANTAIFLSVMWPYILVATAITTVISVSIYRYFEIEISYLLQCWRSR